MFAAISNVTEKNSEQNDNVSANEESSYLSMKLSGVGFLFRLWYLMEKINAKQNYQHIILMLQLG